MALPLSWVKKIFDKLSMVYGHKFMGRWSGMNLDDVMNDWAHELDGLERRPEAIKHALQHLPSDDSPTVLQFRDLCRRAPEPTFVALPSPEINQVVASQALAAASQAIKAPLDDVLHRQREHMRIEMHGMGKSLTPRQREFWRIALRSEILTRTNIDTAQPFDIAELSRRIGVAA